MDDFEVRCYPGFKEMKLIYPEEHSIYFHSNGIILEQEKNSHIEEYQIMKGLDRFMVLVASGSFQVSWVLNSPIKDFRDSYFFL